MISAEIQAEIQSGLVAAEKKQAGFRLAILHGLLSHIKNDMVSENRLIRLNAIIDMREVYKELYAITAKAKSPPKPYEYEVI